MPKTFQFPVWLQGTKEEQEAEAQRQALALAVHSRAKMTEAERLVGRGKLLEETARGNLEQSKGVKGKKEERKLAKAQLADALAMQGQYSEAVKTHTDKHRRKYFRQVGAAIEKDDSHRCACKDRTAKMNDVEIALTPRFEREKLFSPVHGELISLVECSVCKDLNARPLRSRLLKHNDALSLNEAMMRSDAERKTIIPDVQILRVTEP